MGKITGYSVKELLTIRNAINLYEIGLKQSLEQGDMVSVGFVGGKAERTRDAAESSRQVTAVLHEIATIKEDVFAALDNAGYVPKWAGGKGAE